MGSGDEWAVLLSCELLQGLVSSLTGVGFEIAGQVGDPSWCVGEWNAASLGKRLHEFTVGMRVFWVPDIVLDVGDDT